MKSTIRALVVALATVIAASPTAKAETNLVVYSNGDCPSGQAVTEALWAIRPDHEWPPLAATVQVNDDRAQIMLGENPKRRREIAVPANCADRANRVALVIAVWSNEIPARPTGAPRLSVAGPAPAPAIAKPSAFVTELGVSGFYSIVGGWEPGVQVEVGRFRRGGWWGTRAVAAYQSTRSVRVDIGASQYDRVLLGALLVLRWDGSRMFLSNDWGLAGAFIRARGGGYSKNQTAYGPNAGLVAAGRVGLRMRQFRIWADLQACRWARKETIQVDPLTTGTSSTSTLPPWDARLGLGASVVFD